MFEDSTFESTRRIRTRSRRWMIATFVFNAAILVALILIPLFYPEALTEKAMTWLITAPVLVEEPKQVVRPEHAATATEMPAGRVIVPIYIPRDPYIAITPEPPGVRDPTLLAGPGSLPGAGCDPLNCLHAQPDVRQAVPAKPHISSGVATGLLIHRVVPPYPAIPRTIHLEGTVVLQATISKSGAIENLRVVSGPALLQQAALDAVKQWQYKPYLLNGEPVEVETTVNVEFKLN